MCEAAGPARLIASLHGVVGQDATRGQSYDAVSGVGQGGALMKSELLRFDGSMERDPAIDAWLKKQAGELGDFARRWFAVMRACGDEVRELMHDGCPVACFGDVPFGYVNVFSAHVNVGFFQGASLPDPDGLLQGTGKFMRQVKLRAGGEVRPESLTRLIEAAYADIKERVENGYGLNRKAASAGIRKWPAWIGKRLV